MNATFFSSTSSFDSADDNNSHYTNSSCTQTAISGIYANYTCHFNVWYYAVNGSWTCLAFAYDDSGYSDNESASSTVEKLLALNVTSPIDYGDLAVGDTSPIVDANVTNFGNMDINVTVYGYGSVPNDGLAMVCEVGNISIQYERYSTNSSAAYDSMTPLSSSAAMIDGLTLPQQVDDTTPVVNSTYWRLYVPPNPFGRCNGTVVFQAELG